MGSGIKGTYFGNYLLLAKLAKGGMAEVFLSKSFGAEGFERLVAIKKMLPRFSKNEKFVNMFIDEANIAARLNHANICQIIELGKKDQTLFIAMEFIHGRDMYNIIKRLAKQGHTVEPAIAAYILSKAADALDYAHRKTDDDGRPMGIIHRDVSPQNILVSFEGNTKLIDFGIAKAKVKLAKTQTGIIKGKFYYMSPEQITDQPIDNRTDIYALGSILYECLTGRPAFKGASDLETVRKVAKAKYVPVHELNPEAPPELVAIMQRALAIKPDDRYQRASELSADLQRFLLAQDHHIAGEEVGTYVRAIFNTDYEDERQKLIAFKEVKAPPREEQAPVVSLAQTVVTPIRRINNSDAASGQRAETVMLKKAKPTNVAPAPERVPALDGDTLREVNQHSQQEALTSQGPILLASDLLKPRSAPQPPIALQSPTAFEPYTQPPYGIPQDAAYYQRRPSEFAPLQSGPQEVIPTELTLADKPKGRLLKVLVAFILLCVLGGGYVYLARPAWLPPSLLPQRDIVQPSIKEVNSSQTPNP